MKAIYFLKYYNWISTKPFISIFEF